MKSRVYANAGVLAAKVAGEDPEMDAVAERVRSAIVAAAAPHTKTGDYVGSVQVSRVRGKRGVTDRLVTVTDPAAADIEWGHLTPPGGQPRRWVPGLGIVTKALRGLR